MEGKRIGQSGIDVLEEQTSFLLEQQENIKKYYNQRYEDFLSLVDSKLQVADGSTNEQEGKDLQFIRTLMSDQNQELAAHVQEDIDFLKEQLKSIIHVKSLNDPVKEREFEKLVFEDQKKLLATMEFKKEIQAEVQAAQNNVNAMLGDFERVLQEEGPRSLVLLFTALADEQKCPGQSCGGGGHGVAHCECDDDCSSCLEFSQSNQEEALSDGIRADDDDVCE